MKFLEHKQLIGNFWREWPQRKYEITTETRLDFPSSKIKAFLNVAIPLTTTEVCNRASKKNLNFCLSFSKQLSHFLARGYFLLVLVNDLVRRWLAGTFAHCTNELKKLLDQRKSTCPGLLDGTFFKACVECVTCLFLLLRRGIYYSVRWSDFIFPQQAVFIFSLVTYSPLKYDDYDYPDWGQAIGWIMALSSIACIPFVMLYKLVTTPGSFKEVIIIKYFDNYSYNGSLYVSGKLPITSPLSQHFSQSEK